MTSTKLTGYPSIDKPWEKYYSEEDKTLETPKCTVYQNIFDKNKDYENGVALNYYGNKIRFRILFSQVESCARALCSIGIKKGDCVNLCTAGVPEAVYVVLACSRIGAIANFLNPLFSKEQMIDRINDTESEWILVLDAMYDYIKEALSHTCVRKLVIIPATNSFQFPLSKLLYLKSEARRILKKDKRKNADYYSWKEFVSLGETIDGIIDVPYSQDTPTVMVYSSGSTGASKGILLTNDGINAFIQAYQTTGYSDIAYRRGLVFLQMIPVWFSTGIVYSILMPLAKGFCVTLEPRFSKESFAKDLGKYRPELTLAATSLWLYIVNNDIELDLSRMLYPITGGEKILPLDEKRIKEYLKKNGCERSFCKGYGMCELGGEVSGTTDVDGYVYKGGGCGYPMLNVIVSAFDIETDEELPYGKHGEIRVCSPARMKGYYKNDIATEEFFKTDKNGNVWGCTGDIGYVDEDGEVFVLGRASDHYCRDDGEVVYLFDIEEKVFDIASINQCKVVYTDIKGTNCLVAHLVLRDDSNDEEGSLINMLHSHLKECLPEYMVPQYYKIRQSMPVHNNGKRDLESIINDKDGLISC